MQWEAIEEFQVKEGHNQVLSFNIMPAAMWRWVRKNEKRVEMGKPVRSNCNDPGKRDLS